jgi:hypothetical protein
MAHEEPSVLVNVCYAVKCGECGKTTWKVSIRLLGNFCPPCPIWRGRRRMHDVPMLHGDWLVVYDSAPAVEGGSIMGLKSARPAKMYIYTYPLSS